MKWEPNASFIFSIKSGGKVLLNWSNLIYNPRFKLKLKNLFQEFLKMLSIQYNK